VRTAPRRSTLERASFARKLPPTRQRHLLQGVFDVTASGTALVAAVYLRYELDPPPGVVEGMVPLVFTAGSAQLLAGFLFGLYAGRWKFGGFEEVAALVEATLLATGVVALLNHFAFDRAVPLSASLTYGLFALLMMAAVRWMWRLVLERRLRPAGGGARRVIVVGAGEGGDQVIGAMMRNPDSPYLPVAVLDDDPAKRRLRLRGVPVLGTTRDLERVAENHDVGTVIIAIPSADATVLRPIAEQAAEAGLEALTLPPIGALFGAAVGVGDIRPLTDVDLLGRRAIDTDIDSIAGYLTGRRVLVTGAGGSIGSELCRQISRFEPASLVMLDRDESALHAVQLSIEGRAMLDSRNLVVGDIRDRPRLREVFAEHHPEVIFHAAALKHLPLLEMHPCEAFKTNCVATQNLLELAAETGTERFVNISTDKAADPISVLGYTKRVAERLTAAMAPTTAGTFLSVRFGNVLGSRGSVLTTFRAQIEAGGPVTVTDPEVTRYFMTVEESVQLVIQAGAVGCDGEALVLDMGEPVRIDDVARQLVDQAHRSVEIVYTGLRTGEKRHEVLFGTGEVDHRPTHPLVSHVAVPGLDAERLAAVDLGAPRHQLLADLRTLCLEVDQPLALGIGD